MYLVPSSEHFCLVSSVEVEFHPLASGVRSIFSKALVISGMLLVFCIRRMPSSSSIGAVGVGRTMQFIYIL